MASKPRSDEILIGAVQKNTDLKVIQWDGASFNDLGEIETDMAAAIYGSAEIVYEQQSGDALILWTKKNSNEIWYCVWNGTTLGPVGQQPLVAGTEGVRRPGAVGAVAPVARATAVTDRLPATGASTSGAT